MLLSPWKLEILCVAEAAIALAVSFVCIASFVLCARVPALCPSCAFDVSTLPALLLPNWSPMEERGFRGMVLPSHAIDSCGLL